MAANATAPSLSPCQGASRRKLYSMPLSRCCSSVNPTRKVELPTLFRGCRRKPSHAARRERPHPAIPRETDHVHLAGGSRAPPFGDAPRAGVLRKNGRDGVRPAQNVARVVANATCRFGGETLAPGGGVERVAELTLECQRHASGRLFAPEPSSANPV